MVHDGLLPLLYQDIITPLLGGYLTRKAFYSSIKLLQPENNFDDLILQEENRLEEKIKNYDSTIFRV